MQRELQKWEDFKTALQARAEYDGVEVKPILWFFRKCRVKLQLSLNDLLFESVSTFHLAVMEKLHPVWFSKSW